MFFIVNNYENCQWIKFELEKDTGPYFLGYMRVRSLNEVAILCAFKANETIKKSTISIHR